MPTFLHVGCGPLRKPQTTPGFNTETWREVRLDIDPSVKPDIIGTMTDMAAVADGSVDAVYSAHNIEHLELHEVPRALAEFLRVLTPDGTLVIRCPDLQTVAERVAEGKLHEPLYVSAIGPISAHDTLYGHGKALADGQGFMAHRCGFTFQSLLDALKQAGFGSAAVMRKPRLVELWGVATKRETPNAALRALFEAHFPSAAGASGLG